MGDAYLAQQPVWAQPTGDEDYNAWLALHGFDGERMFLLPVGTSYSVIDDGHERVPVATIPRRCRELQADGSCGIHDKPERPRMCGDWPWEPMQLKALSYQGQQACGYQFQKKQ